MSKNTRLVTTKLAMSGEALDMTLYYGNKRADRALLWFKDYGNWEEIRAAIEYFRLYGLEEDAPTYEGDVV